jgi:hypothetical protein
MAFELYFPGFDSRRLAVLDPMERRRLLLSQADLVRSSGPWIAFPDRDPVFDALDAGFGIGFNASPLFGVLHHPAAWNEAPGLFGEARAAMGRFAERNSAFAERLFALSTPREQVRAYIAENVIEQFGDQLAIVEATCRDIVRQKAKQIPGFDSAIKIQGRQMLVSFPESSVDPVLSLLSQNILARKNDEGKVEFQLPLNLSSIDFEFLIDRIAFVWERFLRPSAGSLSFDEDWGTLRDHRSQYQFHVNLLKYKIALAQGKTISRVSELEFVRDLLPTNLSSAEIVFATAENWTQYRSEVAAMQTRVYEPSRQTAIEKFDALMSDPFGFGLLIAVEKEIAGMSFMGPLELFPEERGTLDDPYRTDRHTMYTLDLTVAQDFRGSLGRALKQAATLLVVAEGHHAVHGRNRDRLAAGMWAINLGLGSYELKRLMDDYPDEHPYRDCIYYRCPLQWPTSAPLNSLDLNDSLTFEQLAQIVNG